MQGPWNKGYKADCKVRLKSRVCRFGDAIGLLHNQEDLYVQPVNASCRIWILDHTFNATFVAVRTAHQGVISFHFAAGFSGKVTSIIQMMTPIRRMI